MTDSQALTAVGPRVETDRFVVYPTGYDDFVNSDKGSWCLSISNGHAWGWKITRGLGGDSSGLAMNRRGVFIFESRGSGHNKARRWPLDEALRIALQHVDTLRINGYTAAEASAEVAARMAARTAGWARLPPTNRCGPTASTASARARR